MYLLLVQPSSLVTEGVFSWWLTRLFAGLQEPDYQAQL